MNLKTMTRSSNAPNVIKFSFQHHLIHLKSCCIIIEETCINRSINAMIVTKFSQQMGEDILILK